MAFKEIHKLNDDHVIFIEYHQGDGEAPEAITLEPLELDGYYVFPSMRYNGETYMRVNKDDTITVSWERI